MKFSKEKPTKPGWYWYKRFKTWPPYVTEIKLAVFHERALSKEPYLLLEGWNIKYDNGYYAGPIQEPEKESE